MNAEFQAFPDRRNARFDNGLLLGEVVSHLTPALIDRALIAEAARLQADPVPLQAAG